MDKKLSLEEAGRVVRYGIYQMFSDSHTKIALGHHMNDRVETVLFNLYRGTGITGLLGITPVRDQYIRPLIRCDKKSILAYCDEYQLKFHTDESNYSLDYSRNRIRLECIPYIEQYFNEKVIHSIHQTALSLEEDYEYMLEQAKIFYKEIVQSYDDDKQIVLNRDKLKSYPISIRKRIYEIALKEIMINFKDISYTHYKQIDSLLVNQSGKMIQLPGKVIAETVFESLIFKIDNEVYETKQFQPFILKLSGQEECEEFALNVITELLVDISDSDILEAKMNQENAASLICYLDYQKLTKEISIRSKADGDRIYLSSIKGRKKLKKWFQEQKVSIHQRSQIPLMIHGDEVLWIIGYLKSDIYLVDKSTKHILKIIIESTKEV
jgi:tRNA(Ile)-lysidine synthase